MASKKPLSVRGTNTNEDAVNVAVVLRCRPLSKSEQTSKAQEVIKCEGREVTISQTVASKTVDRTYHFDRVFGPKTSQESLYNTAIAPMVDEVLNGFNCTIFAYGQTGTGKTHTMTGDLSAASATLTPDSGVIPRAVSHIFNHLESQQHSEYSVRCSFLELYNEEITDLLSSSAPSTGTTTTTANNNNNNNGTANDNSSSSNNNKPVRILEDPRAGVVLAGLEEVNVRNSGEIFTLLDAGNAGRRTAETLLNKQSSRSHSVFIVSVSVREVLPDGEEVIRLGKLYLVDLAGSENITRSGAVDARAKEAGNINKSLLTLGRVITALVEGQGHVPYRDSKLTRLLRDSLGGRTKTCIIATIAPTVMCQEETVSTLDYAHRAKNIKNRPEINQKISKTTHLKEMSGEIERLRAELVATRDKNGVYLPVKQYEEDKAERAALVARVEALEEEKAAMDVKVGEMQDALDTAMCDIKERDYCIEAHVLAEQRLVCHATNLNGNLKTAAASVAQLFLRYDEKNVLEDGNTEVVGAVKKQAVEELGSLKEAITAAAQCQAQKYAETKTVLDGMKGRKEEAEAKFAAQLSDLNSKLQQAGNFAQDAAAVLADSGAEAVEWLAKCQQEYITVTRAAAEESMAALSGLFTDFAAKQATEQSVLKQLIDTQEESFTAIETAAKQVLGIATERMQAQATLACQSKAGVEEALAAQGQSLSLLGASLQATITKEKNNVLEQVATILQSFESAAHKRISTDINQMTEEIETEKEKIVGGLLTELETHAADAVTATASDAELLSLKRREQQQAFLNHHKQLSNYMSGCHSALESTKQAVEAAALEASQTLEDHSSKTAADVDDKIAVLRSLKSDKQGGCGAAIEEVAAVQAALKRDVEQGLVEDSKQCEQLEGVRRDGDAAMASAAVHQVTAVVQLSSAVDTALEKKYAVDKKRDQVPAERTVVVPPESTIQQLRAQSREELGAAFRANRPLAAPVEMVQEEEGGLVGKSEEEVAKQVIGQDEKKQEVRTMEKEEEKKKSSDDVAEDGEEENVADNKKEPSSSSVAAATKRSASSTTAATRKRVRDPSDTPPTSARSPPQKPRRSRIPAGPAAAK
jgi:kinesin family protein 11